MPIVSTKVKESNLVTGVITPLKDIFNTDIAIKEFSAGYGIADIVLPYDYLKNKNRVHREPLDNYYELLVYMYVQKMSEIQKAAVFENFSYLPRVKVAKMLRSLARKKYLVEVSPDAYIEALDIPRNPIKKIIAIEAKLRDYRSGLLQARRYQYFADECYVALAKDYFQDSIKAHFEDSSVGLIVYDMDRGSISDIKTPTGKNEHLDRRYNLFAKELLLSRLNG